MKKSIPENRETKALNIGVVSNNEVAVCRSYNSCYRPEKMQHDKNCGKYCEFYKAN